MCFFCGLGVSKWAILWQLCGFATKFPVMGQAPKSDEVQQLLKLEREAPILVQSCQRHMLKNGSACVDCAVCDGNSLCSHTMKKKSRNFWILLNFSTAITLSQQAHLPTQKLTIARLSLGQYALLLRSNNIFLSIGSMVWPNNVMFTFLEDKFRRSGRSKIPM